MRIFPYLGESYITVNVVFKKYVWSFAGICESVNKPYE